MLPAEGVWCSIPIRGWGLAAAILVLLSPGSGRRAAAQELAPDGVNDSTIRRGKEVFDGPANCGACHGTQGGGTDDGPSLIDGTWLTGSGSLSDIVTQVVHGTPRREAKTGQAMPMRGWVPISDDDVHAVAAYVWWLSRPRSPEP